MASTLHATDAGTTSAPRVGFTTTDALLLLMALIWGINFAVVKFATGAFAPLAFNTLRITLATVVLFGVVLASGQALPRGRDRMALLGLGTLGNGIYQIFFIEGIARTRAGDAALLIAAAPALMAVMGWLRGSERTGPRGVAGIALSLTGIGLVVFGDQGGAARGASTLLGDALILLGCVCWSAYTVLLKPYTERIDGVVLSAVTMAGGAVPLLLLALPALARTPWSTVSVGAWAAVLYSGLFALALAYFFWYRGVRILGPTRTGMYANLQPVIALLVAWATLGETPQLPQLAGAACIFAGLVLTRLDSPASTATVCE
ncbi:MAG TPA: DMT family transporter [Gemmatimonadaceae bacterium]|nr:DMT family transporter [Gemmatimonadaceae bacterium]